MKKILKPFKAIIFWFKKRRWYVKILLVLLVVGIGYLATAPLRKKPITYNTEKVSRDNLTETVTENGNVQAIGQVNVYATSTGVLTDLYIKNGDKVSAGDKLFNIKSTSSDEQIASAYATYATALNSQKSSYQSKLILQAQIEKDRQAVYDAQNNVNYVNSHNKNPSTNKNYTDDQKKSIYTSLDAAKQTLEADLRKFNDSDVSISAANAQLNSAWLSYKATQSAIVTATIAGTVSNLSASVGDKVLAYSNNLSAAANSLPVLIIGNLSDFQVMLQLNEIDINKVSVGQTAKVTLDAVPGKTYEGKVISIDDFGTDNSGVITYNIYINIIDKDKNIKPGMSANVTIETAKHQNVLTVPNSAIKPYKGGKAVQVLEKTKDGLSPTYVPVQVGIKGINKTEIVSGVNEGTEVVVGTGAATTLGSSTQRQGGGIFFRGR